MKNRLLELNNMLANYSQGNFDYEVELSSELDEIDTIISGVNMLGEELRETTVSRNFFSSIYNSAGNAFFVIDIEGIINDVNKTVNNRLGYKNENIINQPLSTIFSEDTEWNFERICKELENSNQTIDFEVDLATKDGKTLNYSCKCSKIIDQSNTLKGYLIIAEDITERKETEKLLVRTIIETQENERKRVANDLHDSLGQELSVIKMMLGSTTGKLKTKETQDLVSSCIEILDSSISGIRSICFDLMPHVLQFGTILEALKELIVTLPIEVDLKCNVKRLEFPKENELMLYRVIQEFISNTLKYAEADLISINIEQTAELFVIKVADNGKGFEIGKTKRIGRGTRTMKTRVESFNGKYEIESKLNYGTKMTITFKR